MSDNNKDKIDSSIDLKELFGSYIEDRIELTKLVATEKVVKLTSFLIVGSIITGIAFLTLLFLSVCAAFFIAEIIQHNLLAFGLVSIFLFGLMLVVVLLRKRIKLALINYLIQLLLGDENN